ncbi:MAG TPA: hypothetical protein PLF35_09120, partial [Prolixibacteraceae bacterium]|nr:hypothetical protein [Prolixibacteraceae bacterium]
FLKHIERTKTLLYIIDPESEDFITQFKKLKNELDKYSNILSSKPYIISISKMDIHESKQKFNELCDELNTEVIPFSNVTREGIDLLLNKIREMILLNESQDNKQQ